MLSSTFFPTANRFFFSLLTIFFASPLFSQAPPLPQSVFDYLTPQDGINLTLDLDLTELINNKKTNQYFPATITTADGQVLPLEVRPRGKYRRKICEVPPLKLKFSKKTLRAAQLDTLNEIKLVVPCFDDPDSEDLLLREYVAYRLFERLNPQYAVRARLVRVAFRDRHVEQTHAPVYCLLLEHEEQVAARLRGDLVENYNLPADQLDTESAAITCLFEYMIGNTDWEIASFRNVYLLKPANGSKIRVIPYDFDFSEMVGAPYAMQNKSGSKPGRKLIADGLSAAMMLQAAQTMQTAKADLLTWCSASFLPRNTVKELNRYVLSFYEALDTKLDFSKGMPTDLR